MKAWRVILSHTASLVLGGMLFATLRWPTTEEELPSEVQIPRELSMPLRIPPVMPNCTRMTVEDEVRGRRSQEIQYFSCGAQDYAGNAKTVSRSEMKTYKLANMMHKAPPPYLPGYRNPCWMEDGGALRCVPRIIVAGLMKCGTSELFRNLAFHPHVLQGRDKEILFWDVHARDGSLSSYADAFQSAGGTIGQKCSNRSGHTYHHMVAVDASPRTFYDYSAFKFHPDNQGQLEPRVLPPQVISRLIPDAKVVIILRNPVTRLYSEFLFFHAREERSHVNPEDFHNEVTRSIAFYKNCFQKYSVRACAYTKNQQNPKIRLNIGFYDVYMKDWLDALPRERLHVIRMEDYSGDKVGETRKLYQFLDLDDPPPEVYEEIRNANVQNARRAHARDIGDMQLRTRQLLNTFYSEHTHNLAKLLGEDRWTWGL